MDLSRKLAERETTRVSQTYDKEGRFMPLGVKFPTSQPVRRVTRGGFAPAPALAR